MTGKLIEIDAVDTMVEKVLSAVEAPEVDQRELRLSNGAVVRLTPPPTMALQLLSQKHPKPQPPIVKMDVDGKTWEEANPNDPTYRRALGAYGTETGEAMIRLMLWSSFTVTKLPKGVKPYEEDLEWVEEIEELLGVAVPESPRLRKIAWIRYRILGNPKDFNAVQEVMGTLAGTSEEAIKAAEEQFQRDA